MKYISSNKKCKKLYDKEYSELLILLKEWGFPLNVGEADSHAMMDKFAALGGNFIDTADVYARGRSEEIIGTWLKKYFYSINFC